ncbi:probable LRR receptor-like serine/threonine-protein kinase At3g47570 [Tripterygium wilfordii]|uniref:probable LRR receptor-like serine/threonine-protein kinase At3g47570 n=1 Tax=Tripterygium wilfordii TaxID=458696 RepID=UPI0018F842AF|nr:probable LRR receptor-like serine/threonine-protein kinase At3g47570 [Tripterygium wilfordii]
MKIVHLLLFFFQIYAHSSLTEVEGLNATTDMESLLWFKLKISDPQNALSGWTQNSSHCTWYGVSCFTNNERVQSLNLTGLGLSGSIPPHLTNLTSLQRLDISNNSIDGTIPVSLSDCKNLTEIHLGFNKLTGTLPSQLGLLRKLEILDFSVNNLTGVIPPTFGNLSSLTHLYLSRNQFHGDIPSDLGSRLVNLLHLQLSQNHFTGEIPSSVYNISSLEFLSVTVNNLSGKLPEDIGLKLPNLKQLLMAKNMFSGMIPSSISNASQLQVLDLSANQFEGPIPVFNNNNKLTKLVLGMNGLTSDTALNIQFFESLRNSTQLELLMIFSNQLSGELPNSIANLSRSLQQFCIADNMFTGVFPQEIGGYPDLISLSVEQNSFTGKIPESIGALKNLENLAVFENNFSGAIPDIFGNFTQLFQLSMGHNQFSGGIPMSIGECHQLSTLVLEANKLSGSIPKKIFGLSGLSNLYIGQNTFHGQLPAEVGNLKHLQYLDLSANRLSGNLTASIGSCSSLQGLYMGRNNFSGSIPSSFGNLKSLEELDLSSNNLSGSIPEELEDIPHLLSLNLSFNHLEGEVPREGVFTNVSALSLEGNNELCTTSKQEVAEELGLPQCLLAKKVKKHLLLKIFAPVAGAALLISMMCIVWSLMSRKKKNNKDKFSSLSRKGLPPKISYADIQLATKNFAAENLIGKGGFGSVYKGVFSSKLNSDSAVDTILAVKVLDLQQRKAAKRFNAECEALRNVRHRNLVKVVTSCSSIDHSGNEFKALVMEFMSFGNLDKWLYPDNAESELCLSLLQRLNIAIDVASAMDYLHHDCDPPLVHCDLKPANVLVDSNMVAHVADFGLARYISRDPSENESSTVGLKGSIGYIAPEYGMGGKASTCGDVYSFGILLLEIFIAKKPTDKLFEEGLSLNKFALAVDKNQILNIADRRLFGDEESSMQSISTSYSSHSNGTSSNSSNNKREECLASVIKVGISCASHSAKERLTMRVVLHKLQEIRRSVLEFDR